MITISTEEFNELLKDSIFLRALEAAGVDNWVGYDYAIEINEEMISKSLDKFSE